MLGIEIQSETILLYHSLTNIVNLTEKFNTVKNCSDNEMTIVLVIMKDDYKIFFMNI